jgi:hypothetical protein
MKLHGLKQDEHAYAAAGKASRMSLVWKSLLNREGQRKKKTEVEK